MIHYDPHRWFDHFFDVRGSLVKEISGRVGLCVLWSIAVVVFHRFVFPVSISIALHSLVGVALGLLLVFRTNASYDRYWEGRKLWGGIVNESRNLILNAAVHFGDRDLLASLTRWTAIFPWATMSILRGESDFGPAADELSAAEMRALQKAQHPAMHVSHRMLACIHEEKLRGQISDVTQASLEHDVRLLIDYTGGCERIRKTPLPFAYVVHLRRALVIYCFTLPFALVDSFGWFTALDVLFMAYTFFGIEEIGVEIEGPFGDDANDLPMRDICQTIHNNLYAVVGVGQTQREMMPEGL